MIELGRAALVLCLGLVPYGFAAGSFAALEPRRRLTASAENALVCSFGAAFVSFAVLLAAFIRRDFSFVDVARRSWTSPATQTAFGKERGTP